MSRFEPRIRELVAEARLVRSAAERTPTDGGNAGGGEIDPGDASAALTVSAEALDDDRFGNFTVFSDSSDGPHDDVTALVAARDGLGPVLGLYVDARTGESAVRLDAEELSLLERAMNDWLVVYARAFGVEIDPSFTVREAAELLVDTHDVVDVAMLLTGVPERW